MDATNDRKVLRIAVGTTNPCKIKAIEIAVRRLFANHHHHGRYSHNQPTDTTTTIGEAATVVELDIQGYNVESNVSDQPYNDKETKCGAMNRARNAYYYNHLNHWNDTVQETDQHSDASTVSSLLPDLAIGIEGGLEIDDNENDDCNFHQEISTSTATTVEHQHNNHHVTHADATTAPPPPTTSLRTSTQQVYCMAWIAIYGRRTEFTNSIFATMAEGTSLHEQTSNDDVGTTENDHFNVRNTNAIMTVDTKEIYGFSKTAMFLIPPSLSTLILDQGMELGHADDILFRRSNSKQASGTVGLLTNSIMDRTMFYEHAIVLAMIPWMHPNLFPNGHAC